MPTTADAFMRLVEAGWDAEAAVRPHGQRTTVVVHVDAKDAVASLHLGPMLDDADRRYLTCDATCEAWFHRDGRLIGAGRTTRTVNRRFAARWSIETAPAWYPGAERPWACTLITSCTGRKADRPSCGISRWSVPTTTERTTAESSPSPAPPTR